MVGNAQALGSTEPFFFFFKSAKPYFDNIKKNSSDI